MRNRLSQASVILIMACLLAACGFQLRGVGSMLPYRKHGSACIWSRNSPNSDFSRDVVSQLAANDVQWTDRENATFRLVLRPRAL